MPLNTWGVGGATYSQCEPLPNSLSKLGGGGGGGGARGAGARGGGGGLSTEWVGEWGGGVHEVAGVYDEGHMAPQSIPVMPPSCLCTLWHTHAHLLHISGEGPLVVTATPRCKGIQLTSGHVSFIAQ